MPNKPASGTQSVSNTTNKPNCFAHHHMTANTYAIYDVCRAMASRNRGIVYFSGPKIAEKFLSMGRNTPYGAAKYLVQHGWFKIVRKSYRRPDGTNSPTEYKVLTHEEWIAEHPDSCEKLRARWQDTLSPSQPESMDEQDHPTISDYRPTLGDARHNMSADRPTRSEQTDKELPIKATDESTSVLSHPSLQIVMDESTASLCDGDYAKAGAAAILVPHPLPENVMDVSWAVGRIQVMLDLKGEQDMSSWRSVIERLASQEYEPALIVEVLNYYIQSAGLKHVQRERAEGFSISFRGYLLRDYQCDQQTESEVAA